MSRSTDPGHFFQSDASEATRARRAAKSGNKNGKPIFLQSKILDIIADPVSPTCVYIAESAGCIRRINVETAKTSKVYRGPTAPLTSVAIGGEGGNTLFAGCWDKDVWYGQISSTELSRRYKGHSDFVKAAVCARISKKHILISGGADAKIMVWDIATGARLHTLRDSTDGMRAVQFMVIDPVDSTEDEIILVSSSSDPEIRRWRISLDSASQIVDEKPAVKIGQVDPTNRAIREHETSVYKLFFDSNEGDLWTASADGTAKCLSRARNWAAEETFRHGDYVRAVVATMDWIVTAGRDEDVKVWDRATGKLFHIFDGHFEEVTGLLLLENCTKVASVSIDGTLRIWPLGRKELEVAKVEKDEKAKGLVKDASVPKTSLLTEEEEAELAELMDDDDD